MYPTARNALLLGLSLLILIPFVWTPNAGAQSPPAAALGRQEVTARIDDRHGLAVTTVRQEWSNAAREPRGGALMLPVPADAAILDFQVVSPPLAKNEKLEERASMRGSGRDQYRINLISVPARGTAVVQVTYAQPITRRGTRRKYIYPVLPGEGEAAVSGLNLRVEVDAPTITRVRSTTHTVISRKPTPNSAVVTYESAEPPDGRDLVIDYSAPTGLADTRARLSVQTPADPKADPYFLLALPPPAALLGGSRALDEPADIIFCVDISGSTRGRKLNAIQEAVHDCLTDMLPADRFGIVAFDDEARVFRKQLLPATPGAVNQALRFVNRLKPSAGSEPSAGLEAALRLVEQPARDRAIILAVLVDGEDFADLGPAARSLGISRRGIRLTTLGVHEDARLVTQRLAGKELRSGPAVAMSRAALCYGPSFGGASFDPGPLNASYIYPSPGKLPALPLSSPVLLFGRLNQAPPMSGTVRLSGTVEGKTRVLEVPFSWEALAPSSPVAALWTNRRIRRLEQLAARERGDSNELLEAVTQLREAHGLPGEE
jgi:hypothetical protein